MFCSPIEKEVFDNTLVDLPRLLTLLYYVYETNYLKEDVAEVGVYKGGTAKLISNQTNRRLHLFDTFCGMPKTSENDTHKQGEFSDTSLRYVMNVVGDIGIVYHVGVFPESTKDITNNRFSLVHIDCDLYASVKSSLEFFYPRVVKGGIIIIDDYLEDNCPGAKKAVDEFMIDKGEKLGTICQSQVMFMKGRYGN